MKNDHLLGLWVLDAWWYLVHVPMEIANEDLNEKYEDCAMLVVIYTINLGCLQVIVIIVEQTRIVNT